MTLLGKPLPQFQLPDESGRTVTRDDLAGFWVVLYAYPKDLTPGCTTESCDFRDAWPRLQMAGAKVYGISRKGALISIRCTLVAARNGGTVRAARRTSRIKVPRPGPSSMSRSGAGLPMPCQTTAIT